MARKKAKVKKTSDSPGKVDSRTSKYRNYDLQDVENAFKDVMENKMSIRSAAIKNGVPASTLRDRVQGRIKVNTVHSGPPPFMPKEDERSFVKHMLKLKAVGYRYRQIDIADGAADYGHYYGKRDISEGPMSRGWIKKFVDRQKKKITYMEYHFRAKCPFPPVSVQKKYYEELDSILVKNNLKDRPHLIYNLSETALTLTYADEPHEPEATIFSCFNALGLKLPPFFIFKGKKPNAKLTKGGPDGLGAVMSESGAPNSRIMQHYLKDHFLKNLEADEEDENTHVLLLYDGHRSRILFPVIRWALEHRIILFVIPPHCTYTVDPHNLANFNPMDICFHKECSSYLLKHQDKTVDRFNICKIASKAYEKVFTTPAIIASYHEAGIYPYKPKILHHLPTARHQEGSLRRRKRKHAREVKKEPKRAKRAKVSTEDYDDEDEDSLFEEESSDFEMESDGEEDVSGHISRAADRDHSYGTCSNNQDNDLEMDGEPALGNSGVTDSVDRQTVLVKPPDEKDSTAGVSVVAVGEVGDVVEEVCIQSGEVSVPSQTPESLMNVKGEGTADGEPKSDPGLLSEASVMNVDTEHSGVLVTPAGGSKKREYMLIKPKAKHDTQLNISTEVHGFIDPGGQLIPVVDTQPDQKASVNIDGQDIVVTVIEVSQTMYDQVLAGGDVVLTEDTVSEEVLKEDTVGEEMISEQYVEGLVSKDVPTEDIVSKDVPTEDIVSKDITSEDMDVSNVDTVSKNAEAPTEDTSRQTVLNVKFQEDEKQNSASASVKTEPELV
ncbi:uncharacterized protein LOC124131081 isoform X2 [Haliotis rufescens]|uniref:uncharacterized protein LOC124131081 isoform X2 n=1 Tax=Haliotis rufescens TaxID=6454 RepID=UPI00201F462A|nr:uncharacterized protein LOC124131081 isoform X2 [Haliotis rufescens]